MKNRNVLLAAIIVLSFIGIADAWYLAQTALTGGELTCTVGALDGCNAVAQSPYSYLLGIPLGVYGAAFYAVVFILASVALAQPGLRARRGLYLLGILGSAASAVFLLVQIFLIKALCIYCIGSAVIAFVICWLAVMLRRLPDPGAPSAVVEPWS